MSRFGFTYAPASWSSAPPNYDDANMARRYGISDPDEAARYGYHVPGLSSATPPADQTSAAETLVLTGRAGPGQSPASAASTYQGQQIPQGGCLGEATRKLGARLNTPLPSKLDRDSLTIAEAEPPVQAALQSWSSCMKSKGYAVTSPFDASGLASSTNQPAPDAQEIAVATADVSCKEKSDLIKIWFTAETAVQKQQIEQNQLALTELRDAIQSALKKAAAVAGNQ